MDRSKQISDDTSCIGASMYLSFDSNSTMYKTMCDSAVETSETGFLDISADYLNNTLEALDQVQMVKKVDEVSTGAPLKVVNQNILQYKAISSTPTKQQIMQNTKVSCSSEALSADLGGAFINPLGVEATFPQDNKENVNIKSGVLSVSSSAEIITSVIEKGQIQLLHTKEEALLESTKDTPIKEKMEIDENQEVGVEGNIKIGKYKNEKYTTRIV